MQFETERFPIGPFHPPEPIDAEHIRLWLTVLRDLPAQLEGELATLDNAELGWRYRKGGWTIAQVVHHLADSHMNSLIRFKLALTEKQPTIRPYMEDRWAELPDGKGTDLADSLSILRGVHGRWVRLLQTLTPADRKRTFIHPESDRIIAIEENIGLYAWHCNHHLAHIRRAKELRLA
ncbi:MAG: bacillithiol transferase BstA [Planctomycetota bacterium]